MQFAAVAATFVAALAAATRSQELAAVFCERLANRLERAYEASDSLATHNLVRCSR